MVDFEYFSASAHQVSLGRGLHHTINMFHSVRELVDENYWCLDLLASGDDDKLDTE
jgi:hypothetical protein